MKICSKCNTEKPYTEFRKHSTTKDGFQSRCKICVGKASKKWYKEKGKTNNASYGRKWRQENKQKAKELLYDWKYKYKGVYGVFENGECLYVGRSKGINGRICQHKSFIKNPESCPKSHKKLYYKLQQHNHLVFGILEECENHKEREQHFIDMYNPMYNNV